MDGQTDGRMDGWTNGRMDEWAGDWKLKARNEADWLSTPPKTTWLQPFDPSEDASTSGDVLQPTAGLQSQGTRWLLSTSAPPSAPWTASGSFNTSRLWNCSRHRMQCRGGASQRRPLRFSARACGSTGPHVAAQGAPSGCAAPGQLPRRLHAVPCPTKLQVGEQTLGRTA